MTLEELLEKLGLTKTAEITEAITNYTNAQTTALKANRDALLKDNKKLKEAAKAFEGLDAGELAEALAELNLDMADVIDRLKAEPKGDKTNKDTQALIDAAVLEATKKLQRTIDKQTKDIADKDAAISAANKARIDETIDRHLTTELATHKGVPELLLPMLRGRVKGEIGEDGKVVLTVLAANGEEMQAAGGQVATVATLVEAIKADAKFGMAFEADGGGSGAKGDAKRQSSTAGKNPWMKGANFNRTEQMKISQSNPALAQQLKKQAEQAA